MYKNRNYVFLIIALSFSLILAACGGTNETSSGEGEEAKETDSVVIGVYGGDWEKNIREAALDQFAEETGIKVEVVAGADAEWYTKIKAANGKNAPYDLLILTPDTIERAVANDLLLPIDAEKVPNIKDAYESVQKYFTFDEKVYAAGFSMGQLGLAFRKDLVPTEPTKWLDLWNPEYKGHIGISSPTYSGGLQFLSGLISALGGEEKNPEDVDKAFEKLAELKDSVVAYPDNPGSIQTLLERGDAWIIPFWDGRVFALQDAGIDLGFVYPEDGPVASVAAWSIVKGGPNEANAYKLLDYLSSPEIQAAFSEKTYYGMSNSKVEYSDELENKVQVGEENYEKLKWVDYKTATPKLAEWTEIWTQTLGGNQ